MGAWNELLARQEAQTLNSPTLGSGSPRSIPSPLSALRARPIRTLCIAVAAVSLLTLFSAAAGGPGHAHLKSVVDSSSSTLQSAASSSSSRLSGWKSGWGWVGSSGVEDRFDVMDLEFESEAVEPEFTVDPKSGLKYPPDVNPFKMNGYKRAKATFVALVRNGEQYSMMSSIRGIEDRFNRKFGYPWVFLNDEPFTQDFKNGVLSMTRSKVYFGLIPKEHWSYPNWLNQTKASEERTKMVNEQVIYGGSESYRHMCRFNSGFFYKHPLMQPFDYYWRVEPGVEFYCDVDYDPFLFMQENKKSYAFTVAIYEYRRTIETLWDTVKEFVKLNPQYVAADNSLAFLVDDMSKGMDADYNLCHFWSNFEIADLRFWRSEAYENYFKFLDSKGGFFYERWGDAPVHSIAAALFLPRSALHFFNDIAYRHNPYTHCPQSSKFHTNGKCFCDPKSSFDNDGYSCMRQAQRVVPAPVP